MNKHNRSNPTVLRRDKYKCRLCASNEDVEVHHITPQSLGGEYVLENLLTLCYKCHHFLHFCNPMVAIKSHKELTKEGIRQARKNGKNIGRPKGSKDKQKRSSQGYINRYKQTPPLKPNEIYA